MSLEFSELPKQTRVKLSEKGEKQFWHRINEFGGIKNFSQTFNYSTTKMYNWKNKESYIPIEIVRKVMGNNASEQVTAYKGKGRSKPIQKPVFPLPENNELLTRIEHSVNLSKETPIYQVNDRGLIERFQELLALYGEVPHKVYNRGSVYELRYPKYLHEIFQTLNYSKHLAAEIDEKGVIEDEKIVVNGKHLDPENFKGKLYHTDKKLKLALLKDDRETVKDIMVKQAEKVEKTFGK